MLSFFNLYFPVDIVKILQRAVPTEAQRIFNDWAKRILKTLPVDCVKYIAAEFPTLQSSTQTSLNAALSPVISTDSIDEVVSKRYQSFIESVPDDAWSDEPLKGHIDSLLPHIAARFNNPNHYLERIFPAISKVFNHASPGVLGQALQNLFTQAKAHPAVYGWLHHCMYGRWPQPSADLNPYNPVLIFSDGCTFVVTNPKVSAWAWAILKSLRNMLDLKLVPADHRAFLVDAACTAWTAVPKNAIETFTSGFNDLTSDQTENLIDNIDWSEDEQQTLLARAWSSIVKTQTLDNQVQTINRILEKGLSGPEDERDRGLRLWLDALEDTCSDALRAAITQSDLNDTHRSRLWRQAAHLAESLGSGFFLDVIPRIAVLSSIEETAGRLFGNYELVFGVLGSADNRSDLSQRLMDAFPNVSTNTVKSYVAAWCKQLSGDASLRKLSPEKLTDDDISILRSQFGNSSVIRDIEKAIEAE